MDYAGNDVVENEILENSEACAERCHSIEGGVSWTYQPNNKTCQVRRSHSGRAKRDADAVVTGIVFIERKCIS